MILAVGVLPSLLFGAFVWVGVRNALLAVAESSIRGGLSSGTTDDINRAALLIGLTAAAGLATVLIAVIMLRSPGSER